MLYVVLALLLYTVHKEVKTRRIPKKVLIAGYVLAAVYILYLLYSGQPTIGNLIGLAVGLSFPYLVRVVSRGGIGLDDVLLWGMLGTLLGLQRFGLMLAVAIVIASVYSVIKSIYFEKCDCVYGVFGGGKCD